jgi:hypothetical protein
VGVRRIRTVKELAHRGRPHALQRVPAREQPGFY